MMLRLLVSIAKAGRLSIAARFMLFCLLVSVPQAWAKDPALSAIELYDNASGAAYLQLNDVQINGKIELRDCSSAEQINKQTYGKLPKITITPGSTLQRGADGVLQLSTGTGKATCVVPENLKLEKNDSASPSELASRAVLRGTPLTASPDATAGPPPIKNGVTLVFTAVPNLELAEYLRAQRASTIAAWTDYIAGFTTSAHISDARAALATLYVQDGQASLAAYSKSRTGSAPSYSDLKNSQQKMALALVQASDHAAGLALRENIRAELTAICASASQELDSYKQALAGHSAGYVHLVNARHLSEAVSGVDPQFAAGVTLHAAVEKENSAVETAISSARRQVEAKQPDKAYELIDPYRAFAGEEPRIAAIVDATYNYHVEQAKGFAASADWRNAVAEYEKAVAANNTKEASTALDDARAELAAAQNKAGAAAALEASKAAADQKDYIHAYEVLAQLPAAQQALVKDDMNQLTALYIQSAGQEAKSLQQAHDPIKGIADEVAIQKAYTYLDRAYQLGNDPSLKDRMDILGNDLSEYYLLQAKHYFAKPSGSGTELGWNYLLEAMPFKAANLDAVRDAMTEASPAHTMRSRLSIRVQFLDQTSQRDSTGFARQLEDAVTTGLESAKLPVKVVRFGTTTTVEPDFQFVGDVLQHHHSLTPTIEAKESKYLAGEHEMPNEEWNKANRDYEQANLELQGVQTFVQGVMAKGKKKDVEEANRRLAAAQKKVGDAHARLDSISKTTTTDIIRTYTYTRKTLELSGVVGLQFRIGDTLTGQMDDPVSVTKQDKKQYEILENVKPEDTQGIKPKGTTPEAEEFMSELENQARDELIASVKEKVLELPRKILAEATKRVSLGDTDGAAEAYLLYLNSTPVQDTPERQTASRYLAEQFNMFPKYEGNP